MRRTLIIMIFLCFITAFATAQDTPPTLVVGMGGESKPLSLTKVETLVRIVGLLAETKTTMTFHNQNARQLAGDLTFPLPEGATVSGYALDINGTMVDGVVVDKKKGREVFEQEIRKGVDPGLVEWVKGNNFKTRVFPIPANGSRTITVKYVSDLVTAENETFYHLPLKFKDKIDLFSLRIEVIKSESEPMVKKGILTNFSFSKWNQGFMAETSIKDAVLTDDLRIAIPDAPRQAVLVEKSDEGEVHFCINDMITEIPAELKTSEARIPKIVEILWDASASRAKTDHDKEIAILKGYFSSFRNTEIQVLFKAFRDAADKPIILFVSNGDITALEKKIKDVDYDGGTQMACISPTNIADTPDFYFLFSDGISNFGKEEPSAFKAPLYIFSADSQTNHSFLKYLALQTGGEYFNLNRMEPAAAIAAIGKPVYSFISADFDSNQISEVYPRISQAVYNRFTLAGKLQAESATITINYGANGKVLKKVDYKLSSAPAASGDLLRRFWAQKKIADLSIFMDKNEKEITSVGKRYGIVTPGTSLIVLENFNQYLDHEIPPPVTLPEMRKNYFDAIERKAEIKKEEVDQRITAILPMWNNRVAWWNTEFSTVNMRYKGGRSESNDETTGAVPGDSNSGESSSEDFSLSSADGAAIPEPSPENSFNTRDPFRPEVEKKATMTAPMPSATKSVTGQRPPPPMGSVSRPAPSMGAARSERSDDTKTNSKVQENSAAKSTEPGVAMKAWNPQTPYLKKLKAASSEEAYDIYLKERKEYGNSPAFFFDCSDYFIGQKQKELGIRILSNVTELELENAALLRIVAHRLAQLEMLETSELIFEEVLKLRSEEPQSYRDLALILSREGKYERAVKLLYEVVTKKWDDRFPEIEVIALVELNNLIAKAKAAGIDKFSVDPRLIKNLEMDLRIVMTWDADMTDMDLWVNEPSGEKAYYGHALTAVGGLVSRDFTRGYGPEEYSLKKAMTGMYNIQTNFFGTTAQSLSGAVTLQVDVFSNYGRPNEKRKSMTLRLTEKKETFTVGEIEF